MYKTIEAVYEKGVLSAVEGKLPDTRTHVLITVLGPAKISDHSTHLSELLRNKGLLKKMKKNPVTIQRRMRNEWK